MSIEEKIHQCIEQSVSEYVRSHGGELIVHSFHDGIVYVRLKGTCEGCSAQDITLRFGLERTLRRAIPEVKKVVLQ